MFPFASPISALVVGLHDREILHRKYLTLWTNLHRSFRGCSKRDVMQSSYDDISARGCGLPDRGARPLEVGLAVFKSHWAW